MNLETQTATGLNEIHVTDALNAPILGIKAERNSQTQTMPASITIYVDKQSRSNPTSERRAYQFSLNREIAYLYVSPTSFAGDKFVVEMNVENGRTKMNTYVERNVSDWNGGTRTILIPPEIEEVETTPIILFDGENYIYTDYEFDGMDLELFYAKNTASNKVVVNSAMFYQHDIENSGEFSLDDIYFKDAFTKTSNKLNIEVDNANIECLTSKNNAFSLDNQGNLIVNTITANNLNISILDAYPIGSIYLSVNNTNPGTLFGGTWESFGTGRTLVGVDTSQTEFNTVLKTGGEKTHTLTVNEIPSHNHRQADTTWINEGGSILANGNYWRADDAASLGGRWTQNTGGSGAHNNLQPYITCYMWKRTA